MDGARGVATRKWVLCSKIDFGIRTESHGCVHRVFKKIYDVFAQAVCLEEKAKTILSCEVQISEFKDVVRMLEDLTAIIPNLDAVKGALSVAKSWLTKSMFL
ncbi:ARID DNA-binding domain-containing protein [Artemisia annua]|uniref:ARID DNA-binding domain-containing protein n=1 Tax=Artemisia annua TaxID=35608 RepID=A0A2U1L6U1_ARTAN|nr:ARID DNA-binding domain-containing protein [Artemisia annua]